MADSSQLPVRGFLNNIFMGISRDPPINKVSYHDDGLNAQLVGW